MEKLVIISIIVFLGEEVICKSSIDVSIRLSENICSLAKTFKTSLAMQPELKAPTIPNLPPDADGICYVWRWLKCEEHARKVCSSWVKVKCPGTDGDDKSAKTGSGKFCEVYQCGWTLDQLNRNWGYNPEHVKPRPKEPVQTDNVFETGATLDFPSQMTDNEI